MNIRFENLGFFNVDEDYLRYLNQIDSEVQYSKDKDYGKSLSWESL
jgi:hypothetical protein